MTQAGTGNKDVTTEIKAAQYNGNSSFGSTNKFHYTPLTKAQHNSGYSITYVTGNKIPLSPFPLKYFLAKFNLLTYKR